MKPASARPGVLSRRPLIALGLATVLLGSGTWVVWPQVRRAIEGWRAIADGVAVQHALHNDFSIDEEFSRAAFDEFNRLAPEADIGQLRLHLVRPGVREGWIGAEERPWRFADLADQRPLRSTSYFPSDGRISEAYADLLEQLRFEITEDAQLHKNIEQLRRDFTTALREASESTRRVRRNASTEAVRRLRASVEKFVGAKLRFNAALSKLPRLGQVERAYLDFMTDAQMTVLTPAGIEAPAARVDVLPDFAAWLNGRRVPQLGAVRITGTTPVTGVDSNSKPLPEIQLDIEAQEVRVFQLSRNKWFKQELVAQFRQSARGTGLFGADGSLGVIPVGAVFARGITVAVRTRPDQESAWKTVMATPGNVTLQLPFSSFSFPSDAARAFERGETKVRLGDIGDVKLVGVICRWL